MDRLIKIVVFILCLFIFVLAGCDSSNPVSSKEYGLAEFSPPEWTWGEWRADFNIMRFVFSKDNVVWIITHNADTTYFNEKYKSDEIKESIKSDTEYRLTYIGPYKPDHTLKCRMEGPYAKETLRSSIQIKSGLGSNQRSENHFRDSVRV